MKTISLSRNFIDGRRCAEIIVHLYMLFRSEEDSVEGFSLRGCARDTGLSFQQVRTAIGWLLANGAITQKPTQEATHRKTVYIIENMTDFRKRGRRTTQKATQKATQKKGPEEAVVILMEAVSREAAENFVRYRREMKKPLNEVGARRLRTHLLAVKNEGYDPEDALALAQERGWRSVTLEWVRQSRGQTCIDDIINRGVGSPQTIDHRPHERK